MANLRRKAQSQPTRVRKSARLRDPGGLLSASTQVVASVSSTPHQAHTGGASQGIVQHLLDPASSAVLYRTFDYGTTTATGIVNIIPSDTPHSRLALAPYHVEPVQHQNFVHSEVGILHEPDLAQGDTRYRLIFGRELQNQLQSGACTRDHVFNMLKYEGVSDSELEKCSFEDAADMIFLKKRNREKLSEYSLPLVVHVDYGDSSGTSVRTICEPEDLLVEFFRYFCHLLKQTIRKNYHISEQDLEGILNNPDKVMFGASLPTIWPDATIEHYGDLLRKSGFPQTITLSEAKSAAIFAAITENAKFQSQMELLGPENALALVLGTVTLLADLGGGTADIASIRQYENGEKVRLGEPVPARGSMCGSHRMNRIFLSQMKLEWIGAGYWEALVDELKAQGVPETVFIERLLDGFEQVKINFDNQSDQYAVITPNVRLPEGFVLPDVVIRSNSFYLRREQVKYIFDQYIQELKSLIDKQIDATKRCGKRFDRMRLAVTGGGSHSGYIMEELRAHYQQDMEVFRIAHDSNLTVAQGAAWALTDKELMRQQVNRRSYGIPIHVLFDEGNPEHQGRKNSARLSDMWGDEELFELPDRLHWGVRKGQPLVKNWIRGVIHLEPDEDEKGKKAAKGKKSKPNEETFRQRIYETDSEEVTAKHGLLGVDEELAAGRIRCRGELSVTVDTTRMKQLQHPNGKRYFEVQFLAEINHTGLSSYWRFVIPRTGKFRNQKKWTDYRPEDVFMEDWKQSALAKTAARSGDAQVRRGMEQGGTVDVNRAEDEIE